MKNRFAQSTIIRAALLALFMGLVQPAPLTASNSAGETVEYVGNEKAQKAGQNERDLLSSIARRQKELDEREAAIRSEEERLLAVKKDIEKRIEELNAIHGRLEAFVSRIDEASGERVKKVARIYASMNPEEAASRIERLDEKTAVMILATISEKQAAKILSFVNLDKSVKLSQSLKINKTAIEQ